MTNLDLETNPQPDDRRSNRRLFRRGLVSALAGGIRVYDRLREPDMKKAIGELAISTGLVIIRRTNPVGAVLVEIGVAAYLSRQNDDKLDL